MNKNIILLYSKMAKSKKTFRRSKKQRGGVGASDYMIGVVGGIGQQTAVPGSNVIAMKDLSAPAIVAETKGGALVALTPAAIEPAAAAPVAPVKGGNRTPVMGGAALTHAPVMGGAHLTPAPVSGGGVLQDVAVPAVLLLANSAFKGRKSMSKRLFKRRSSSRRRRSFSKRRR